MYNRQQLINHPTRMLALYGCGGIPVVVVLPAVGMSC